MSAKFFFNAARAVLGRSDIQILTVDGQTQILPEDGSPPLPAIDQATLDAIDAQLAADTAAAAQLAAIDAVAAERDRRMRLGFDYDFADARGVHRIGTTDADMRGWREVDDLADIYERAGAPSTVIQIVTDTGATQVTALEWLTLLKPAFAAFRQPLWGASFMLQAMSPIPSDYASNEAYWP